MSGTRSEFGDYFLSFDHSGFNDDHDGDFGDDLRRGATLPGRLEFRSDVDVFTLPAEPGQRLIVAASSTNIPDLWLHAETYDGPVAMRWLGGRHAFVYTSQNYVDPDIVVTSRSGRSTGEYQILMERAATDDLPIQIGTTGRDVLVAAGAAELFGWDESDRLTGSAAADYVYGGRGHDRLMGGPGNDFLSGGLDNDVLLGSAGVDRLHGGAGNDRCHGGSEADWMRGDTGSDLLSGGLGNDYLRGSGGADILLGGGGADRFHFARISDSLTDQPDTIEDFAGNEGDRIDLRDIDADTAAAGDQAFAWLGPRHFSGRAAQLRLNDDRIEADVDGDGKADLVIVLNGLSVVTSADLLL